MDPARLPVEARADVNARSTTYDSTTATTPLIMATQGGHANVVEYLSADGAEGQSRTGNTARRSMTWKTRACVSNSSVAR